MGVLFHNSAIHDESIFGGYIGYFVFLEVVLFGESGEGFLVICTGFDCWGKVGKGIQSFHKSSKKWKIIDYILFYLFK